MRIRNVEDTRTVVVHLFIGDSHLQGPSVSAHKDNKPTEITMTYSSDEAPFYMNHRRSSITTKEFRITETTKKDKGCQSRLQNKHTLVFLPKSRYPDCVQDEQTLNHRQSFLHKPMASSRDSE